MPWFRDFLTSRTQTVIVEGIKSRLVDVTSGVPQGTRIAALCFLLFINGLPDSVTQSFTGLFCDDTLIAKEINSPSDAAALQEDLDNIVEWTDLWGMSFNTDNGDNGHNTLSHIHGVPIHNHIHIKYFISISKLDMVN